jgi:hypothetical protein
MSTTGKDLPHPGYIQGEYLLAEGERQELPEGRLVY